jgi:O-antigen/teichoic acid export membrane protein
MKNIQRASKEFALFVAVLTLVIPANAHAYIDPGTGSVVVQAVIGAVVAVGFFLKTNWLRVKNFAKKLFGGGKDDKK